MSRLGLEEPLHGLRQRGQVHVAGDRFADGGERRAQLLLGQSWLQPNRSLRPASASETLGPQRRQMLLHNGVQLRHELLDEDAEVVSTIASASSTLAISRSKVAQRIHLGL